MAPANKTADNRRKSGGKPSLMVNLTVPSAQLRQIIAPESIKEETPVKDVKEPNESPATPAAPTTNTNGDNASDSNAATPAPEGTPAPSSMGPPTEGSKKKGVKRSAAAANGGPDAANKPKGRPGPKKKARLEDGTIDHTNAANRTAGGHKLGPKANQGAINAGLRALDRSGKPCRRWARGDFQLKSFTGVVWGVPRWTAPPKKVAEEGAEESAAASADNSSSKENKENGEEAAPKSNSNSNSGADAEARSAVSIHASSPAPMAVSAAG